MRVDKPTEQPLRVLISGFGNIAAGYASDPQMKKYYNYASHIQVLNDHPQFDCDSVIDIDDSALLHAQRVWNITKTGKDILDIPHLDEIDIVVISSPPGENRFELIKKLPNLKGVIVEKPLGADINEATRFARICEERDIVVQVNFLRRAEKTCRELSARGLESRIGPLQAANIYYGNGLLNNGSHMVDLARMLIGEVQAVQALSAAKNYRQGPIKDDINIHAILYFRSGIVATMSAIDFQYYRENSLDMWGQKGRLALAQEGSFQYSWSLKPNRLITGEREIALDDMEVKQTLIGDALYELYSDLAQALLHKNNVCSSARSALKTQFVLEAILTSFNSNGELIKLNHD